MNLGTKSFSSHLVRVRVRVRVRVGVGARVRARVRTRVRIRGWRALNSHAAAHVRSARAMPCWRSTNTARCSSCNPCCNRCTLRRASHHCRRARLVRVRVRG